MQRSKPVPYSVRTQKITRAELKQVPTPEGSDTWRPIGYYELISTLDNVLSEHNVSIQREEIFIQRSGNLMFAIIDLQRGYASKLPRAKDVIWSMGIQSSLNKRIGVQILAGLRVLSNDNLLFSTDHIGLKKRYTTRTNLHEVITDGYEDFIQNYKILQAEVDRMKSTVITESQAKLIIFEVFYRQIFPIKWMRRVTQLYLEPEHKDFKVGNLWSLINAAASCAHKLPPGRKFSSLKQLAKTFHRISEE